MQRGKIHIVGKKIARCLGYDACYRNGGVCVQKDDMVEVREKMLAADIIVLASPIYFYSMTSQMKTVIDRTYAFYQQLESKTFYFLITCGAPDAAFTETMLAALRGFICCAPNANEGGVVRGIGAIETGEIHSSTAMTEAYGLGRSL